MFSSELNKACGFTKATLYALHPMMQMTVKKGATKEKKKYINIIDYQDQATGTHDKIVGVASSDKLCQTPVF